MQKRICPNCFARWFSSDASNVWECDTCGHEIPVLKEDLVIEQFKNTGGNLKMEKLKAQVEKLAKEELEIAMIKHPLFVSKHQGYAIIKEEIEETEDEIKSAYFNLNNMWRNIKVNNKKATIGYANDLKNDAICLAAEAIQVAAMAQKFINSFNMANDEK